ncbi:MAG: VOC family protein [Myxococcota bacterium]
MQKPSPLCFHYAFAVDDLKRAESFYATLLGCAVGRRTERWIDFDFFGHQLTAHLADSVPARQENSVDGDSVPVPHFGVALSMELWRDLGDRLRAQGAVFLITPRIRFAGLAAEQGTFFLKDPAGNALEFKGISTSADMFAAVDVSE